MLAYAFTRNRSHAGALLLVLVIGFSAPLVLYNPKLYLIHTVQIASSQSFYPFAAFYNLLTFFSKALSILIPAMLIGWITMRSELLRSDINFLFITFVFSFILFSILALLK